MKAVLKPAAWLIAAGYFAIAALSGSSIGAFASVYCAYMSGRSDR